MKIKNTDENTVMHHPRNDPPQKKREKKKRKLVSKSGTINQSTSLFNFLNK
jgi:hypothetical protein